MAIPASEVARPEVSFPEAEHQRLMELLDDAPRPAFASFGILLRRRAKDITRGREPIMRGPDGKELIWGEAGDGDPKVLLDRYGPPGPTVPSRTYLALGPGAYFVAPQNTRLLVWRQLDAVAIRISLFDTERLSPVGKRWAFMWRYEAGDSIIWKTGLVASTDVPLELAPGIHPHAFPESMRIVKELLMVGFVFAGPKSSRRTTIFIARPEDGTVEIVPLGWWARRTRMRGFIARLARDPISKNIVGDGVGFKPFLIRPSGELIGWIVRRRKERRARADRVTH